MLRSRKRRVKTERGVSKNDCWSNNESWLRYKLLAEWDNEKIQGAENTDK